MLVYYVPVIHLFLWYVFKALRHYLVFETGFAEITGT
jgi:hypothetical protein